MTSIIVALLNLLIIRLNVTAALSGDSIALFFLALNAFAAGGLFTYGINQITGG